MQVAVKYIDTGKYNIELFYDDVIDSPAEWGNFKLVTFNWSNYASSSKVTDVDPSDYFTDNGKPRAGLASKLRAGTAFLVDYFEHGNCRYSVAGGHRDQWDTTPNAGIIFLEKHLTDGADFEQRKAIAEQELEAYTQWANGEVYGYTITDARGEIVDSLCGLYDLGAVADNIRDVVDGIQNDNVTYTGEASSLGAYINLEA